ncbi:MAG: methionyl-tRNA formyltransferase [Spirochaetes bacterium]|nr:methionyl-tRNA formyltransferase [Spirochaetota bacterium]
MKVIFSGTPEFSIPSLEAIHLKHDLQAIITQPDKPYGRGKKIKSPEVKEYAIKNGIDYFQPNDLRDSKFISAIESFQPDLIIDVSYGKILPEEFLQIPKKNAINVHPSLLPGYKGPSPIRWVLINGEEYTGVSAHIITNKIDSGRIIYQEKIKINSGDTYDNLYRNLSTLAVSVLEKSLSRLTAGGNENFIREPSDPYTVKNFYARKFTQKDHYIDWNKSSQDIYNLIRGLDARTIHNDQIIKIYHAEIINNDIGDGSFQPGEVAAADRKNGIVIKTGTGYLKILRLQKENKKILNYSDFLNGVKLRIKEKFTYVEDKIL